MIRFDEHYFSNRLVQPPTSKLLVNKIMASIFFSHRISLALKFSLMKNFEACPTQLTRITQRPWGVSDLKFFTDDDCFEPIDGGAVGGEFSLDLW